MFDCYLLEACFFLMRQKRVDLDGRGDGEEHGVEDGETNRDILYERRIYFQQTRKRIYSNNYVITKES